MIKIVRLERKRERFRECVYTCGIIVYAYMCVCVHVCVHDCAYMCLLLYVSLPWSDSVTDVYVCVWLMCSALPVPVRKVAQSQRRILGPLSQAQTNDLNRNGLSTAREPSATKSASHSRLNSKLASNSASTKPTGLSNVLSTDVDGNVPQRTLKVSTTFPNWPTPSSVSLKLAKSQTGLLSVVEEQQQLGKLTIPTSAFQTLSLLAHPIRSILL